MMKKFASWLPPVYLHDSRSAVISFFSHSIAQQKPFFALLLSAFAKQRKFASSFNQPIDNGAIPELMTCGVYSFQDATENLF